MTIIQRFQRRDRLEPPAVDMDRLAADVLEVQNELARKAARNELAEYAPKRRQAVDMDAAVCAVATFGELPAAEIDLAIDALKKELASIEIMAQNLRNAYAEAAARLMKYIDRQKSVLDITRSAFQTMRDDCAALDQPELPFSAPAAKAEAQEDTSEQGAA